MAYKLSIFIRKMRNADFDISFQELDEYMRELLDDPQLALPDHMSMLDLIRRHVLPVVVLGTPLLVLTGYPMIYSDLDPFLSQAEKKNRA